MIIGQLLECEEVVLPTREVGEANLDKWNLSIFRLRPDKRTLQQHIVDIGRHVIRMTGCKKENIKVRLNVQCELEILWKLNEREKS